MRRDFQLPEDDVVFLNSTELEWETVNDQGMQWLIVHGFDVSKGYNIATVNVAIKIEVGYPRTPLDMAYFFPNLSRLDEKPIGALSPQSIEGVVYQRWSRHRTAENPWRDGVDEISTHLALVSFWFEQEFLKRPNEIPA